MRDTLRQNVHFAIRSLVRNRGFALVMILTLALGTGANTAIFSVAESVLLKPLPYPHDDQLVEVWSTGGKVGTPVGRMPLSYQQFQDAGGLHQDVSRVAAFTESRYNLTGQGEPREVQAAETSPSLFELLGVQPAQGRGFASSDLHGRVVVLSHLLSLQLFGSEGNALDRVITLDGNGYTVVGVMPRGFAFPDDGTQLWVPLGQAFAGQPDLETDPDFNALNAVARLRDGIDIRRLQSDLAVVAARRNPATGLVRGGYATMRLRDEAVGDARTPLLVLLAVVAFVLIIGCVNAANLLLARSSARQREFAVRRALGAERARLIGQLLTESVLLALVGGAAGLLLAHAGVSAIVKLWPAVLPRTHEISVDAVTLLYALLISLVTGMAFGLAPALRLSSATLDTALREGSATATAGRRRHRLQRGLVAAEIALALIVLTGAGLLVRSFARLRSVNPGYDVHNVLAARIRLIPSRYQSETRQADFYARVVRQLGHEPGVESASVSRSLPMSGELNGFRMTTREIRPDDPTPYVDIDHGIVGPDFFHILHIPLLSGRTFADADGKGTQLVAVINAALARRLWPNENPVGRTIDLREGPTLIVGVVGDVHYASLTDPVKLDIYQPFSQVEARDGETDAWIVARSRHDPLALATAVRRAVAAVDPAQPVAQLTTLTGMVSQSTAARSFNMTLVSVFALLALGLAVVGIYGVTAYTVQQRTREIGVRLALGAARGNVLQLVLLETAAMAAVGISVGLLGALALTRLLASLLYDISVTDATTFAVTTVVLAAAALLAGLIPAVRAARIDPVQALRAE